MGQPTVAIVGASANRSKFGNKSIRAHQQQGYEVFAVNPRGGEIEGLTVYKSIGDIPVERINRVSMYVPPAVGEQMIGEISEKGCDELWLNPGAESDALVAKANELGLKTIVGCSIVELGVSPADFPG